MGNMATKKSAKKSAKKAAKKTAKKAVKKSTKKAAKKTSSSTRSLEALQTSVFDSEVSNRYEDSDIYSSSMRDDNVSYASSASEEQGGESSRFRMIGIAVLAIVLIVGFYLIKGQCGKDKAPTKPTISEPAKPQQEPAKPEQAKPEQEPAKPEQAKPEQEQPASAATTYTVVAGDLLSKIAAKTGVPAADIQKANPKVQWNKIRPGDVLKIPAK